jgi:metallo-beta-lactamase class B
LSRTIAAPSRGCTSWSFTVEEGGRELHALVFCSATVAANRLVGPPQYDGIVEDYRRTFARLRGLKVDLPLAPHPEFFGLIEKAAGRAPGGPNSFIDPAAMGALAEVMAADFEVQLAAQTARAAARGQ